MGKLATLPQCNFSLEFPELLSQNYICYYRLSVSGISKIMCCGILINMPYWLGCKMQTFMYVETNSSERIEALDSECHGFSSVILAGPCQHLITTTRVSYSDHYQQCLYTRKWSNINVSNLRLDSKNCKIHWHQSLRKGIQVLIMIYDS